MAVTYTGFGATAQAVVKVTKDLGSITNATADLVSFDVIGARPGQFFIVAAPDLEAGLVISGGAFSDAKDVVKVKIGNVTGAPIDAVSQDFYFLGL